MSDPQDRGREAISAVDFRPLDENSATPGRRIPPLAVLLGGVAVIFLACLFFLFTARSVEIEVGAIGDPDIAIGGLAVPLGNRFLLRPGSYEVTVAATGYRRFSDRFEVTDAASQRWTIELEPLPGIVTIDSRPPGAQVAVDGDGLGATPLEAMELEAGEYRLTLSAPRFLDKQVTLAVEGRRVEQQLTVELAPAWADVSIDSRPSATILVDGKDTGLTTPATVEILQGEHRLGLKAPAYAPWNDTLSVEAGEALDLGRVELEPAEGVLSLASRPSGANVTVDGSFRGQTPLELALAPGRSHEILLARPGYQRRTESVRLDAGTTESRTIDLEPLLGKVVLEVSPGEAQVSVNGRALGRAADLGSLQLPAEEQLIEISLPGYEAQRQRVVPRPGVASLVAVELLTEQEARLARIPPSITTGLGQTLLLFDPAMSPQAEFELGASRRDPGRRANEVQHTVRLERMFYLQTTEVTNAQFRSYLADHNSGQVDGNSLNREDQPAVALSWQQAAAFCNWLSRREGLPPFYREERGIVVGFDPRSTGYRLPTEAEWAWVARVDGEALRKFSWGNEFPPRQAVENLADQSSAFLTGRVLPDYNDGFVVTAPVGSFPANQHRVHDLGGNVAEWVHDVYAIPTSSGVVATDPLGSQSGDNYTLRGASWAMSKLTELRLSFRDYGLAGRDDVGFRLARYAE